MFILSFSRTSDEINRQLRHGQIAWTEILNCQTVGPINDLFENFTSTFSLLSVIHREIIPIRLV